MEDFSNQKPVRDFLGEWTQMVGNHFEEIKKKYSNDFKIYIVNSKIARLNKRRQKKFLKKCKHIVYKSAYPVNIVDMQCDNSTFTFSSNCIDVGSSNSLKLLSVDFCLNELRDGVINNDLVIIAAKE